MGITGFYDFLESQPEMARMRHLKGGADIEENLAGKVVGIDVSMWINRDYQSTRMWTSGTEEQKKQFPIWQMFNRVKNYLVHAGAKSVVGVFDASKSTESKLVRGNVTKNGHHLRRNLFGLNKQVETVFTQLGLQVLRAPPEIGEADALLGILQKEGLVDIVDSDDSDVFAYGGRQLLKDAKPSAALGDAGNDLWTVTDPSLRWEIACCAVLAGSDMSHGVKGIGLKTACKDLRNFLRGAAATYEFCKQFLQHYPAIPDNVRANFIEAFEDYAIERKPQLQQYLQTQKEKQQRSQHLSTWGRVEVDRLRRLLDDRKDKQFDKNIRAIVFERYLRGLTIPAAAPLPFYKIQRIREKKKNGECYQMLAVLDFDCKTHYNCQAKTCQCREVLLRKSLFDSADSARRTDLTENKVGAAYYDRAFGGIGYHMGGGGGGGSSSSSSAAVGAQTSSGAHGAGSSSSAFSAAVAADREPASSGVGEAAAPGDEQSTYFTGKPKFIQDDDFPLQGAVVKFTCKSEPRRILEEHKDYSKYGCTIPAGPPNASTTYLVCGEAPLDDGPFAGKDYTFGTKYRDAQELRQKPGCKWMLTRAGQRIALPVPIREREFLLLMERQKRNATRGAVGEFKRSAEQEQAPWEEEKAALLKPARKAKARNSGQSGRRPGAGKRAMAQPAEVESAFGSFADEGPEDSGGFAAEFLQRDNEIEQEPSPKRHKISSPPKQDASSSATNSLLDRLRRARDEAARRSVPAGTSTVHPGTAGAAQAEIKPPRSALDSLFSIDRVDVPSSGERNGVPFTAASSSKSGPAAASSAPPRSSVIEATRTTVGGKLHCQYAHEVEQLAEMGFKDTQKSAAVLAEVAGDLDKAIDILSAASPASSSADPVGNGGVSPPLLAMVRPPPAPAAVAPRAPARIESLESSTKYRDQLQQLESMGFADRERSTAALDRCNGDVTAAIGLLLGS
ncbi:unnamed protein product [Amoebophrya sp. A120]|nr:unnamed protein product [Amoebophrya sp. A120]|eukprot:GSA120T00004860001.1